MKPHRVCFLMVMILRTGLPLTCVYSYGSTQLDNKRFPSVQP